LYFFENGANQRSSKVIYDREYSTVSLTGKEAYDWGKIFEGACWFHTTGITPELSRKSAEAVIDAVGAARRAGLKVSCDLNFRKLLWRWEPGTPPRELAGRVMREVLAHVDVLIANEEDAADVVGIHAGSSDVESGELDVEGYRDVAAQIVGQFPGIQKVAFTLRQSVSASHNNWGAILYDAGGGVLIWLRCAGASSGLMRFGTLWIAWVVGIRLPRG
jgi:2-dehydro-3-deoxygluconokinase